MSGTFDRPIAELLASRRRPVDPGLADHNRVHRLLAADHTVVSAIEQATHAHSRRIAVVFGNEELTYAQLGRDVADVADDLRRNGVSAGDVVAVRMEPSRRRLTAVLGVLFAGAAFLPLDSSLPEARIQTQVADAGTCAIVTDGSGVLTIRNLHGHRRPTGAREPVLPATPAYVMYTSGSTGKPKGVLVTHLSLVNRLEWMRRELDLSCEDRVLHKTAFGFDVSLWEQLLPLMVGARVVIAGAADRGDADGLARLIRERQVTLTHFVPAMLAASVDSGGMDDLPSLRTIVASGEALARPLAERVSSACGAALYNFYGPTEATIDVTSHRVMTGDAQAFVPLGHPIDNTAVHVLDGRLRPVAVGEHGELCIGGTAVAVGYLGRGRLTAESFVPDPFGLPGARLYRTGDLVRLHPNGTLEFLGRADRQVKLRGFRIELAEVEHALLADPRVSNASVVLHRHPVRGDSLVAHVVVTANADRGALDEQINASLAQRLPTYMVPSAVLFHDALPLTKSGKVDRRALPPPDEARGGIGAAPIGDTEHQLVEVWKAAVGLSDVGRDDNFFQVGGDSIAAIRVVAHARRAGLVFEVRDVFEFPTIAGLALTLQTRHRVASPASSHPPPVPVPLACWAGRRYAHPSVITLRVADDLSVPYMTQLVSAVLMAVPPGRPEGAEVQTIALDAAPTAEGVCGQVRQWWHLHADSGGPIGAALLIAPETDTTWVILAGNPARVDRTSLCLVAAEIEARHAGANTIIGPTVPAFDLLASASARTRTEQTWVGASAPPAYRSSPALTSHHVWRLADEARPDAHHACQGALLTALGDAGFTSAEVTLAPDREWVAQTGWDTRTILGQWSTRRRVRRLLSSSGWESVRAMKRLSRGMEPDDVIDRPELTVDVEWIEVVRRPGFWREDRELTLAASSDANLSVAFTLDEANLSIRWQGSDAVDESLIDLVANRFATALGALTDAGDGIRQGADSTDHPLAGLDIAQARAISQLGAVDCYLLAPMQEGLLVRALFWPGSDAYHNQNVLDLLGPLDVERMERSWHQIAAKYELLRTGFAWEGLTQPVQFVTSGPVRPLEHLSWAGCSAREVDERLARLLRDDRARPFDLRRPGIYRIYLIRVTNDRHLLVWSHHHILLDGWCLSLIWGDVFALYGLGQHTSAAAKPAPRPFRDFVRWLQDKKVTAADTAYWRDQVAEIATACHLSNHGPEREGPFETRRVRYSSERTHGLSALAHGCRVTLNAVVQAAWSLLLSTFTSQRDVVHGVSISGRPPELDGVETMVGLFINTVPLRVPIVADETVTDLVSRVQMLLAQAAAHGHVPLAEILAHWPDRGGGTRPFDTLIAFESYPEDNLPDGPVDGVAVVDVLASEKTEFPLGLIVLPGAELELHWNYDTSHFTSDQVERLIATFDVLVDGMSAHPRGPVMDLPLLCASERRLVDEWCRGPIKRLAVESPFDGFLRTRRASPGLTALVVDGRSTTYAELDRAAMAVAARLISAGCRPGDRVLIAMRRSETWVHSVLGAHAMGAAPLLIDDDQPMASLARMVTIAAPVVALVDRSVPATVHTLVPFTIDVDESSPSTPSAAVRFGPSSCVVHAAGSTGEPKAVGVLQFSLVNRLEWALRTYSTDGPPRLLLNAAPPSHDSALWELYFPLFAGGTVAIAPYTVPFDVDALIDSVRREAISVLHLTPNVLKKLIDSERASSCTSLRLIVTGGDTLAPEVVRAFFGLGLDCRLHQTYGEAGVGVTDHACRPADSEMTRVPIGRPIDNAECHVLDEALRPVPMGVEGDLYLAGESLAFGYLADPCATALSFVPNPRAGVPGARMFRTGDRAARVAGGELELRDRRDHHVMIRGVLRELPRTSSGQVDRVAASRLRPAPPSAATPTRPETVMESLIARTWARELGLDAMGPHQDVFRFGATSLSVMRVFARLKALLPASSSLEVAHLFKGPTPAQLAELVLAPIPGSGAGSVLTLTTGDSTTPLFLVHPVQGLSTGYLALRDYLADLEIFAFNNPRIHSESPFTAVEEMAGVYVEWVRSLARDRTPLIGGWSFGGVVALEMARQIRGKSGAVGAVLLIDTHRDAGAPPTEAPSVTLAGDADLLHVDASRNHAMTVARNEVPYDGRVVLLRARDGEAERRCGWEPRVLPAIEVIDVAGTHHELFDDGYVASTAEAIRRVVVAGHPPHGSDELVGPSCDPWASADGRTQAQGESH